MRLGMGRFGVLAGLAIVALALTGNGCSGDDSSPPEQDGGSGGSADSGAGKGGTTDSGLGKDGAEAAAPESAVDGAPEAFPDVSGDVTGDVTGDAPLGAGGSSLPDATPAAGGNASFEAGVGGIATGGSNANTGGSNAGGSNANTGGGNTGGNNASAGGSNAGGSQSGGSNTPDAGYDADASGLDSDSDAAEPDSDAAAEPDADANGAGGNNSGGNNSGGNNSGGNAGSGVADSGADADGDAATISYLCTWDYPDSTTSPTTGICGLTASANDADGDERLVPNEGAPGSTTLGALEFTTNYGNEATPTITDAARGSVRLRQQQAQHITWTGHNLHAWVKVTTPGSLATIGLIIADNSNPPHFFRGPTKTQAVVGSNWVQLDFDFGTDAAALQANTHFGIELIPTDTPDAASWLNTVVLLDNLWID